MHHRRAQLGEPEQPVGALAIIVEHAQIVGLLEVLLDYGEVPAIALLGELERDLVGDEFLDALA